VRTHKKKNKEKKTYFFEEPIYQPIPNQSLSFSHHSIALNLSFKPYKTLPPRHCHPLQEERKQPVQVRAHPVAAPVGDGADREDGGLPVLPVGARQQTGVFLLIFFRFWRDYIGIS
jgi:hypothetical protein